MAAHRIAASGRLVALGRPAYFSRFSAPQAAPSAYRKSIPGQQLTLSARPLSTSAPARTRSPLISAVLLGLLGAGSYLLGALYPPSLVTLAFAHPAPPRLDANSEEGRAAVERIEAQLQALPLVKSMSLASSSQRATETEARASQQPGNMPGANPSTAGPPLNDDAGSESAPHYVVSRPYRKYPQHKAQHSMTAGALRGPGLFAVPPLVLAKTRAGAAAEGGAEGDSFVIVHAGRSLCGHDGVIHGGLIATICDEALARTAFYSLPSQIGVTARLEIDYRAPVKADQFIVVRTNLVEAKGRKAVVEGVVEDVNGKRLAEARAIFVEPKYAKFLNNSSVREAIDG